MNAVKGQREEGTTYDKMNEYVMSVATVALVIAAIVMYVTPLKPTMRDVGVQSSLSEEQAISMQMLTVAELKIRCKREHVQPGYGATRSAMIAILVARRTR